MEQLMLTQNHAKKIMNSLQLDSGLSTASRQINISDVRYFSSLPSSSKETSWLEFVMSI